MAGLDPAIPTPTGRRGGDHRVEPGDDKNAEPGDDGRSRRREDGNDPTVEDWIWAAHSPQMSGGWVYIMTNRPHGTLYIGVTSDLARRIWEHREGVVDGFSKKYNLKRLVWAERHDDVRSAIQRERNLKHWPRRWKLDLILQHNPDWEDLFDRLG